MKTISKTRNGVVRKTSSISERVTAKKIEAILQSKGYDYAVNYNDARRYSKCYILNVANTGSCYFNILNDDASELIVRIANHSKRNHSGKAPDVVEYYFQTDKIAELNIFDVMSKKQAIAMLESVI